MLFLRTMKLLRNKLSYKPNPIWGQFPNTIGIAVQVALMRVDPSGNRDHYFAMGQLQDPSYFHL